MSKNKSELYPRIYKTVNRIPRGCVAAYGQIAEMAGIPGHARQVGYALHNLPEGSTVPWHRVVNRKGRISFPPDSFSGSLQKALLESEGVVFNPEGEIISTSCRHALYRKNFVDFYQF